LSRSSHLQLYWVITTPSLHVGFVVGEVAIGNVVLQRTFVSFCLSFHSVRISPPVLKTHPLIYPRRYLNLLTDSVIKQYTSNPSLPKAINTLCHLSHKTFTDFIPMRITFFLICPTILLHISRNNEVIPPERLPTCCRVELLPTLWLPNWPSWDSISSVQVLCLCRHYSVIRISFVIKQGPPRVGEVNIWGEDLM
jgi:hypothetical protein